MPSRCASVTVACLLWLAASAMPAFATAQVSRDPQAAVLARAGWQAVQTGRAQEAADYFERTLALDPQSATSWLGAGLAAHLLGNVRDWLYVRDHAEALWQVIKCGKLGETYNIGGHNEWANIRIVELICDLIDEMAPQVGGNSRKLITFIKDRLGHDRRYAIDASKIEKELGWVPAHRFEQGIRETVRWYVDHQDWVRKALGKKI